MDMSFRFSGRRRPSADPMKYTEILERALTKFRDRLSHVCVYVEDVNGPRGGVDLQCRCVLHLRRRPPVVIKDHADNLLALVRQVASRAVQVLSQKEVRRSRRATKERWRESPWIERPAPQP